MSHYDSVADELFDAILAHTDATREEIKAYGHKTWLWASNTQGHVWTEAQQIYYTELYIWKHFRKCSLGLPFSSNLGSQTHSAPQLIPRYRPGPPGSTTSIGDCHDL